MKVTVSFFYAMEVAKIIISRNCVFYISLLCSSWLCDTYFLDFHGGPGKPLRISQILLFDFAHEGLIWGLVYHFLLLLNH